MSDAELDELRRQEVTAARQWASPERLREYDRELTDSDGAEGWQAADAKLLAEWKWATGQDETPVLLVGHEKPGAASETPQRRDRADQAQTVAAVPEDARKARQTANLMNGADPQLAAASGTKTEVRPPPQIAKAPAQERTR